jgi:hypothetical protein
MVVITESCTCGHNGFDEEDADESSYPGKEPDFVLEGDFVEPCEWWEREGVKGGFCFRGTIA